MGKISEQHIKMKVYKSEQLTAAGLEAFIINDNLKRNAEFLTGNNQMDTFPLSTVQHSGG